jgi:polyisoprenoid-binding protein YceI
MVRSAAAAILALSLFAGALAPQAALAQTEISSDQTLAPAGGYTLDKAHSSVTMKVSHMGLSYYTLRFDGVDGSYTYDPAHPEATKLNVAIDANSIDTGDAAFNRQIASEVFEAAKYPQIRFVSTAVRPGAEGRGTVVGDLTFHGVTKPATLDVIFNGAGAGKDHQERMGFSATSQIRRADFGANKYAPLVGDNVSVVIEVEFTK